MAIAATSPKLPPVEPKNISRLFKPAWLFAPICARGVGPLSASAILLPKSGCGVGQSDFATSVGKDKKRNTRPTNAGLKGFLPKPPNVILPIPIATKAPMITK